MNDVCHLFFFRNSTDYDKVEYIYSQPVSMAAMRGRLQPQMIICGHWALDRRSVPNKWKSKNALLGFTRMNTALDGVRLGQALFKIYDWLHIVHKVSCLFTTDV